MSLFASLQSILHFVESLTGRVEILSGKKRCFFQMIQKTLFQVSAKTQYSISRKQTLMVDVMAYLRSKQASVVNCVSRVGHIYTAGASLLRPIVKKKREIN